LKVRVTEREPVAQINIPTADAAGGIAVAVLQLDADGYIMKPLDPRQCVIAPSQMSGQLPVVTVLNPYQLQAGRRLESPQAQAALKLIGAFDHSPMAGLDDLRRVDVTSPGVIVVKTGQGSEITFALENLEQQLARWRKIYDLGQSMNKAIASADLAVANNVPVRWMAASAAPVTTPRNSIKPRRKNV
jgi:hypothetical protein